MKKVRFQGLDIPAHEFIKSSDPAKKVYEIYFYLLVIERAYNLVCSVLVTSNLILRFRLLIDRYIAMIHHLFH